MNIRRFGYSLKAVCERYPDGAPNRIIAQALGGSEDEVEACYQRIVQKLKEAIQSNS